MRAIISAMCLFAFAILAADSPPMTGTAVPELAAFDEAMQIYMREIKCSSGTLAIMKDGKIVFERGYGWSDKDHKVPTQPDTIMRIASVSKPITSAAVKRLIAEKKLSYDLKAFEYIGIPPGGAIGDQRIYAITVKNLLEHRGGWNRDSWGDPMFMMGKVKDELKLDGEPKTNDVIRWMMTKPLQAEPGAANVYSNFGYCVLGRVIEKATGKTYEQYVTDEIFKPLGMTKTKLSRNFAKARDPNEVWYPCKDTDFSVEVMDAHGGWSSTAGDLCRFMQAYWIIGEPRNNENQKWIFFGSLPGTTSMAMQRVNGINVAALFNGRTSKATDKLKAFVDETIAKITEWPK